MATATRAPTSDEAISGTWNGTAGTRYTVVDDYPDTTPTDTLLHGTTAGDLTFGFSAFTLPSNAINISVAVLYYDQKTASQAAASAGRLKVGGTYYNATTHNPATSYTQRTDTWATNPKTSAAWTVAEVNGTDGTNPLQAFGFYSTDASPTINFSSVQLQVTYGLAYTLPSDLGKFFLPERNLARYSEQFENAYWIKGVGGISLTPVVTANDAAAPDGTLTADRVVLDLNGGTTINDRSEITGSSATPSVVGRTYIFSVWLKTTDATSRVIQLSHNGATSNLVTVTGTWQRFTSATNTAADTTRQPRFALRGTTGTAAFASLHVWGLQWEEGTSITDYDPTGPAGAVSTPFIHNSLFAANVRAFTVGGVDAGVRHNVILGASAGAFSITGKDATLTYTPFTGETLTADKGSFLIAGVDAGVRHNAALIAVKGSIVISPVNTVVFRKTYNLVASTRAFNLNLIPASLLYSGGQVAGKPLYYQSILTDPRKSIVNIGMPEHQLVYYVKNFFRIL